MFFSDREARLFWKETLDLPDLATGASAPRPTSGSREHVERLRSILRSKVEPEYVLERVQHYLTLNIENDIEEVHIPIESGRDLLSSPIDPRDGMLVDDDGGDFLWRGGFHVMGGKRKSFKTFAAFHLALALAEGPGNHWLSFSTVNGPHRTLMILGEGDRYDSQTRLLNMSSLYSREAVDRISFYHPFDPVDGSEIKAPQLVALMRSLDSIVLGSFDHVIVDPYVVFSEGDENSNTEQREVMKSVLAFTKRTKCAVTLNHHARKLDAKTKDPGFDDVRGAGVMLDLATSMSLLWRRDDDPRNTAHFRTDGRYAAPVEPHILTLDPASLLLTVGGTHGGSSNGKVIRERALEREIREHITKFGGHSVRVLAGVLQKSKSSIGRALKTLTDRGDLVANRDPSKPGREIFYTVAPPPAESMWPPEDPMR